MVNNMVKNMVKKQILVEIEYDETKDGLWNDDKSGFQAFSDSVINRALMGSLEMLSITLNSCKEEGIDIQDKDILKNNQYYQYCLSKNEVVNSMKMTGYIDDNNKLMRWNPNKYEFEENET